VSRASDGVDRVTVALKSPISIFGLIRGDKEAAVVMVNHSQRSLAIAFDKSFGDTLSTALDDLQSVLPACSGGAPGTRSLGPQATVVLELK
jgi:hypothetical protein